MSSVLVLDSRGISHEIPFQPTLSELKEEISKRIAESWGGYLLLEDKVLKTEEDFIEADVQPDCTLIFRRSSELCAKCLKENKISISMHDNGMCYECGEKVPKFRIVGSNDAHYFFGKGWRYVARYQFAELLAPDHGFFNALNAGEIPGIIEANKHKCEYLDEFPSSDPSLLHLSGGFVFNLNTKLVFPIMPWHNVNGTPLSISYTEESIDPMSYCSSLCFQPKFLIQYLADIIENNKRKYVFVFPDHLTRNYFDPIFYAGCRGPNVVTRLNQTSEIDCFIIEIKLLEKRLDQKDMSRLFSTLVRSYAS